MSNLWVNTVWGILQIFSKLPLKFHYAWADIISWILKNLVHYRRNAIYINLSRAFPEKKYGEIKAVANEFYRHLGEIIAEAIWFGGCDYEKLRKYRICEIENMDELCRIYGSGKSMTVLSTHCGNWELMGGTLCYNFDDSVKSNITEDMINVVYKAQKSRLWDEIMRRNRIAPIPRHFHFNGTIESSRILRTALKNKDKQSVYIYPTDQYPYYGAHDIGIFMNQPTKAMLGSAGVACKLGMSVVYMKMKRVRRGSYMISFIPICADASLMSPEEIMRKYFDLLEEEIRETPHNWLWTHKRWK